MPTIPIVTAQQGPGVLQLPPVNTITGFEEVAQLGETLIRIDSQLKKQQDDLDFMSMTADYDNGLAELKLGLKDNLDFASHEQSFLVGAKDLRTKLMKSYPSSPTVTQAFVGYERKHLPKALLDVRISSRELLGKEQLGRIAEQEERLSSRAAEALTPEERDTAIETHSDMIDRAPLLDPLEKAKRKIEFNQKHLEKNMDYLGRTDRALMFELDRQGAFAGVDPLKRDTIREAARLAIESEDRRAKAVFKEAQDIVLRQAYGLANFGLYPKSSLEEAKANKDPFISPIEAHALEQRNNLGPSEEGNPQVRVLRDEYLAQISPPERVEAYRKKANALGKVLGHPNKELTDFLEELKHDTRAERNVAAAELATSSKSLEETIKSESRPAFPGIIGQMMKNKEAIERADRIKRLRRGEKLEDILKDYRERRKRQKEAIPQSDKDISDLDQGIR